MKKHIAFLLLSMAVFFGSCNSLKVAKNTSKLSIGMNKEQIFEIMGTNCQIVLMDTYPNGDTLEVLEYKTANGVEAFYLEMVNGKLTSFKKEYISSRNDDCDRPHKRPHRKSQYE